MPSLILIRGLPGSGKSTIARRLCRVPNTAHFEADMFFMENGEYKFDASMLPNAHRWCQNETRSALQAGMDVVVSNTFTTLREMEPYFAMAREFGLTPNVVLAEGDFGNVHGVPAEALERMKRRFQYDLRPLYEH